MVDVLQLATFVIIVLIGVAWYLSYSAARLDRLHAKVEGAMSVLDAQLVRRAEAALELANSGVLDPATATRITGGVAMVGDIVATRYNNRRLQREMC